MLKNLLSIPLFFFASFCFSTDIKFDYKSQKVIVNGFSYTTAIVAEPLSTGYELTDKYIILSNEYLASAKSKTVIFYVFDKNTMLLNNVLSITFKPNEKVFVGWEIRQFNNIHIRQINNDLLDKISPPRGYDYQIKKIKNCQNVRYLLREGNKNYKYCLNTNGIYLDHTNGFFLPVFNFSKKLLKMEKYYLEKPGLPSFLELQADKNITNTEVLNLEKYIPKDYKISEKLLLDFNNDNIKDVLLTLDYKDTYYKSKLILLEGIDNGEFKTILNSDDILSYPDNNGQGNVIRNISASLNGKHIVIGTTEYSGGSIEREFHFKYINNDFYLYKYILSLGNSCNNYTVTKIKINENIQSILKLKDFSVELFFEKYYNSPVFQSNLKRQTLPHFENEHSNLLKKFKEKNKKAFKKIISKLLVYSDNEELCEPYQYLNMYLYLDKKDTVSKSNNIAFFFDQAGYHKEAIYLLEKIIKKHPKRTVAYYNLGDAYWALGDKKKAKKVYKIYIKQMKQKGKQKQIPKIIKDKV